ncbi:MAG: VOC family protein [Candidatus Rokubacteria bacterium]|nr:VOC family protein [Candidatus Rokubacteria bacterium]MBI2555587.1 VOC family protein [Candidatus Rokubacteria bacterium]
MGLQHLSLKTRDLKATERFYTEVLGLRVAFRHRGMVFLESPGEEDVLDFCQVSRAFDPRAGGLDHFGLHVERRRFGALRERVKAARVKIVGRRGRWAFYFKDPNGYMVELYAD